MPAITFGVESVLVSQTTIDSLEKESARWAKDTLNLPLNTPNVCSQVLLGVPSFKEIIYTNQLKFHQRLRQLPKERYASQALKENENGGWKSPYMDYIYRVRAEVGMVSLPPDESLIDGIINSYCVEKLNVKLEHLSSIPQLEQVCKITRARSAKEGEEWRWINLARMGAWAIKRQLGADGRRKLCGRDRKENSDLHCVTECSNTRSVRKETGVSSFFTAAKLRGLPVKKGYSLFVHGLDLDGNMIDDQDYKDRGKCLARIFQEAEGQSFPEGLTVVGEFYYLLLVIFFNVFYECNFLLL